MKNRHKTQHIPTIGVILAGGAGKRLGGVDKGLINLGGQPLVEHVLGTLEPQVDKVMIVANRHLDSYAAYGHDILSDSLPGFAGPLAGMLAALRRVATLNHRSRCLFVPVDAPLLPDNLADRLNESAGRRELAVVKTIDGLQPVCCLVGTEYLDCLEADFEAGERSPAAWLKRHKATPVNFSEVREAIWSLNTPEELARAQQTLGNASAA